mmetsp:Transcript_19318/g.42107  ORF Transcript_19318/g.42107 Transcript_19318/m.42107 type:complete len:266 (+) Transcript_19318:64-861(+)
MVTRRVPGLRRPARLALALCLVLALLALAARYIVLPLLFWRFAEACERPKFSVLGTVDAELDGRAIKVELRRYSPSIVAVVRVPKSIPEPDRRAKGFGQVAGYIFGANKPRMRRGEAEKEPEKISMTAPVQSETVAGSPIQDGDELVSFTMPSKYGSIDTLPVPRNRNVTLKAVPAHFAAIVGFRGPPPSQEKVLKLQEAMEVALRANGLRPQGGRGPQVLQYHDPFATPNLLRWNEVLINLEPKGLDGISQRIAHGFPHVAAIS